MMTPAKVVPLRDTDPRTERLHEDLVAAIKQEKYEDLSLAQIVGTLEFLKWNIINQG